MLRRCIALNLDCADICGATATVMTRQFEANRAVLRAQLESCAVVCEACAAECEKHGKMHAHCAACADACTRCAEACRALLGSLPAAS
jgi:hypothetical protein